MKLFFYKIYSDFLQFFFGAFLQNKDNNICIENQLENELLTDEIYDRQEEILIENQLATIGKLKGYIKRKYQEDGLLITKKQLVNEAACMYINYREAGLIDDDCKLIPTIMQDFTQYIS